MITHYYKFTITIADEKQPSMKLKVLDALRKLGLTDEVKIECCTEGTLDNGLYQFRFRQDTELPNDEGIKWVDEVK